MARFEVLPVAVRLAPLLHLGPRRVRALATFAVTVVAGACGTGNGDAGAQGIPRPDLSTMVVPAAERVSQDGAELPRLRVNTDSVTPTGKTIRVGSGDNLQRALDRAVRGDLVLLAANGRFVGNFVLRAKAGTGWVTVRTETSLPPSGTRMRPSLASSLARITSPNADPAIRTATGASGWRLVGLEITHATPLASRINYGLVLLGDPRQGSEPELAKDLILDRVYVHGDSITNLRRCVALNGGASAIIDSWLSDCHERGADAQAVAGWGGPGPYRIENNFLEGSGENVIFGGADPAVHGLIPSDIEIRRNHLFKPPEWMAGPWEIKNLLELKNAQRVLVEDNVFDGSWKQAQVGWAMIVKSENQKGGCPWCTSKDVTVRRNLIRHVGAGINVSGVGDTPYGHDSTSRRIDISENWLEGINEAPYRGVGRLFQLTGNPEEVRIVRNVALSGAVNPKCLSFLAMDRTPSATRLTFSDNVVQKCSYGLTATDLGVGASAWTAAVNSTWRNITVIGASQGATYPPGTSWHPTVSSALSTGAGIRKALVDRAVAGVVVAP